MSRSNMFSVLNFCDDNDESSCNDNKSSMQVKTKSKSKIKSKCKKMSMGEFLSSGAGTNTYTNTNKTKFNTSLKPFGFTEVTSQSNKKKRTSYRNDSKGKYNNDKNFQYKNNKSMNGKYTPYRSYDPEKDEFKLINSKFPHLNKETKKNNKKSKIQKRNIGSWGNTPDFSKSEIIETKQPDEDSETSKMQPLSIGMEIPKREEYPMLQYHKFTLKSKNNQNVMNFDDINNDNNYYDDYGDNYHNDYDDYHNDNNYVDDDYHTDSSYDDY